MKGLMKNFTVNVRDAAGNVKTQLKVNDAVYGTVYTDNRERIRFSKIYRADGTIENLGGECNAVTNDAAIPPVYYMTLTNEQEPQPPAPVVTEDITITVERDGWKPVTVTVKQEKL